MTGPTIEEMSATLIAAGWKRKAAVLWKSSTVVLFLGPYGAWEVMTGMPAEPSLLVDGYRSASDGEGHQRHICEQSIKQEDDDHKEDDPLNQPLVRLSNWKVIQEPDTKTDDHQNNE